MQADRNKSNMNAKNGTRTQAGFVTRNGQPLRSLSDLQQFEIAPRVVPSFVGAAMGWSLVHPPCSISKLMERASCIVWLVSIESGEVHSALLPVSYLSNVSTLKKSYIGDWKDIEVKLRCRWRFLYHRVDGKLKFKWILKRETQGGNKLLGVWLQGGGYCETSCLMDLSCECKKRYEMAMSHEREHPNLFIGFR
ncbi:hypothetical protein D5086_008707 [Populus alba]|uniref:Uncharacterized protein n=1 Tax=Populus alba TaxID=43335 RepID=A0ACC4CGU1_POPAL